MIIKFYKTDRGIYKVEENTLTSFIINPFDFVISCDKQNYSDINFIIDYIIKAGGIEITNKEYDSLFDSLYYLLDRQTSLHNNIKEFVDNNLK